MDTSARATNQEELAAANVALEVINSALSMLFSDGPVKRVLEEVLQKLNAVLKADGVYINKRLYIAGTTLELKRLSGAHQSDGEWQEVSSMERAVKLTPATARQLQASEKMITPLIQSIDNHQDRISAERTLLTEHGFKVSVDYPIVIDGGQVWGYLSMLYKEEPSAEVQQVYPLLKGFTYSLGHYLQRKEVEQQLEEQRLNTSLMQVIPDHVFLMDYQEKKIIHYNVKEEFIGFDLKKNQTAYNLYVSRIHPDDVAQAVDLFRERIEKLEPGEYLDLEYRMQHKDESWHWFSERATVVSRTAQGKVKTYMIILQDITTSKEAEHRLKASEQRYKNFIKYSNDGIYFVNCGIPIPTHLSPEEQTKLYYENAFVQECNDVFAKMYGLATAEDIIGTTARSTHEGENYEENTRSFIEFVKNGYRIRDFVTIEEDKKGGKRYILNHGVGIIENGHLIGMWGTQQDITERLKAEQALKLSEERLEMAMNGAKLGIWDWDMTTGEATYNNYWASMIGYDLEEVDNNILFFMQHIHPDDHNHLNEVIQEHIDSRSDFFEAEFRFRSKEGDWKWIYDRGQVNEWTEYGIPKRAVGMHMDITQRKNAEINSRKSEALQKAILNALPDLKFRINKEGIILGYFATGNESNLYASPKDFLNQPVDKILPVHVAKGILFNLKKAIEQGSVESFEYILPVDGKMEYYEARISVINENEAMVVVRNISILKKAQTDLQEKLKELDIKNNKLKEYIDSNLQLEHFAYIASHDLREPVRTMRSFAQLLERRYGKTLDDAGKSYIQFIVNSANHMNQLIEDLLIYSRVNTVKDEMEQVDIRKVVEEVLTDMQDFVREQEATIHIEGELPVLQSSGQRMRQVFQNLIANAVKFRKVEEAPVVVIQATDNGSHYTFSIKDNGIGVDPEFKDKIFLLFKKLHSREEFQGTGLGLAICKKIIERFGGEIWVDSMPDEGATFSFTLAK
ncbi:MAG: PAS domain-containing protein [Bacteroidota bacterium]